MYDSRLWNIKYGCQWHDCGLSSCECRKINLLITCLKILSDRNFTARQYITIIDYLRPVLSVKVIVPVCYACLQCFSHGCLGVRNSIRPVTKLSDEVLAVRSEVHMICTWSRWCHCHPIISCFIKIQIGLAFLVPASAAYPGCPGKDAVKRVSVWLSVICQTVRAVVSIGAANVTCCRGCPHFSVRF